MKLLWLCNIVLPIISRHLGEEPVNVGGWLSGSLSELAGCSDVEIMVCFPYSKCDYAIKGNVGSIEYYGFKDTQNNQRQFEEILESFLPDIIHVWGTEYRHTFDMVNAAEQMGILDRLVVSIQGLVSIIGKYHYYCGLPGRVRSLYSFRDFIKQDSIKNQKKEFEARGIYEASALKKVHHVIGRTDWDEACTKQFNPKVQYHFCNESLRDVFYAHQWEPGKCERHSIFLSQANYPIKGFHLMLEAMPLILERFPDAHLYTTGEKPQKPQNLKRQLAERSYPKYIRKLIEKLELDDFVSFLGPLDEDEMCRRFLKSNVFVSPSSIENSSNSVCEAMLLGVPVISSDVGGIKSLLEHNKEGCIYQWDAPYMLAWFVCKFFENEERAAEMGRRARERALIRHDREKNLRDMLGIYETIRKSEAQ